MYLFSSLLRMGDLISVTKSHQATLSALLAEFASWKGLRVKVWHKGGDNLFPGGVEYHLNKDYMKKFIANEIKPYIFHMSWYVLIVIVVVIGTLTYKKESLFFIHRRS